MAKLILAIVLVISISSLQFAATAPQQERDFGDHVKDTFLNEWEKIFGGHCADSDQCSVISHCSSNSNTCTFNWWVVLVALVVAVFIVIACCSCICCPCCFLYQCCCK